MLKIKKSVLSDRKNRPVAVQVDFKTFEKIEKILEDNALGHFVEEHDPSDVLYLNEAKDYYNIHKDSHETTAIMNIYAEKLGLIEWIAKLNDSAIIEKLKRIHDECRTASDWSDDISSEDRQSIERGFKDFEDSRVHSHESAKKLYEKYL